MIASWRGAVVAVALAVALAVVALVDGLRGARGPVDRALVPGFTGATSIAWDGGPRLARDATGTWRFADGEAVDRDAIDAVLAAVRGARWQREAPRATAGAIVATVHVEAVELAIGQPLAGTAQTWIARGDRALLVDAWVARALALEPWQLHARHPLAGVDDAEAITIAIGGRPAVTIAKGRREKTWIDPARLEAFAKAARELAIVSGSGSRSGSGSGSGSGSASESVSVSVSGSGSVTGGGPCPNHADQIAIAQGCVSATAWRALVDAATAVADPSYLVADPRPLPLPAITLQLADGTIVFAKPAHVERAGVSAPLDPTAATELAAALATPGVVLPPRERAPIIQQRLVATTARGPIELALVAPDLIARDDFVMLRIGTGAFAILARPIHSYIARALWAEEPTTITRLVLDGTGYTRGAVVGEWTGDPPHDDAIERYVTKLARLTALDADPPATFAIVHRVAVEVVAPDGRRETHTLELGALTSSGCPAHVPAPVMLPSTICTLPND